MAVIELKWLGGARSPLFLWVYFYGSIFMGLKTYLCPRCDHLLYRGCIPLGSGTQRLAKEKQALIGGIGVGVRLALAEERSLKVEWALSHWWWTVHC